MKKTTADLILFPKVRNLEFSRNSAGVKAVIKSVCRDLGVIIITGKFTPDFLWLRISFDPGREIGEIAEKIRSESAFRLSEFFPEFSRIFWQDDTAGALAGQSGYGIMKEEKNRNQIGKKKLNRFLVTGGAGFIGSNLVDRLIESGFKVDIIDDLSSGKLEYVNPKAVLFRADIRDRQAVEAVFAKGGYDGVFHLAAQMDVRKSVADPAFDNEVNIGGGLNILEACGKTGVEKIVFTSTGGAIYGEAGQVPTPENYPAYPLSPYGISKLAFEKYLYAYRRNYGLDFAALRLANVYGPRQYRGGETGVVSIFIDNAVSKRSSVVNGDGRQTRDYVYVDDVARALQTAMISDFTGEFNIGTGKESDLLEVIRLIEEASGESFDFEFGPAKKGEQMRSCLDISKAINVLGWKPLTDLPEGLRKTLNWALNNKK